MYKLHISYQRQDNFMSSFERSFLLCRMNYSEFMWVLHVLSKQTLLKYETFHFVMVLN